MPSRLSVRRVTSLVVVLALCSCASRSPGRPGQETQGEAYRVGEIRVTFADELPADRQARFTEEDGATRLRGAIEEAVQLAGKFDPRSDRVLHVQVTRFRLRSSATAFWFGMTAGGDMLDVAVEVREGDHALARFTTGAGTTGTTLAFRQTRRFEKLVRRVAERVAAQL